MPIPYLIALVEAVAFLALGAAATLGTALVLRYRHFLAFSWRIWLWGSVGLIICNVAFAALLFYLASVAGIVGGTLRHLDPRHLLMYGLIEFGPLLFTSLGVILGSMYGWRLAKRRAPAV